MTAVIAKLAKPRLPNQRDGPGEILDLAHCPMAGRRVSGRRRVFRPEKTGSALNSWRTWPIHGALPRSPVAQC